MADRMINITFGPRTFLKIATQQMENLAAQQRVPSMSPKQPHLLSQVHGAQAPSEDGQVSAPSLEFSSRTAGPQSNTSGLLNAYRPMIEQNSFQGGSSNPLIKSVIGRNPLSAWKKTRKNYKQSPGTFGSLRPEN